MPLNWKACKFGSVSDVSFCDGYDQISSKTTFQQRKGSIWTSLKLKLVKEKHSDTTKCKLKSPEIRSKLLPSVKILILGKWWSGNHSVHHLDYVPNMYLLPVMIFVFPTEILVRWRNQTLLHLCMVTPKFHFHIFDKCVRFRNARNFIFTILR